PGGDVPPLIWTRAYVTFGDPATHASDRGVAFAVGDLLGPAAGIDVFDRHADTGHRADGQRRRGGTAFRSLCLRGDIRGPRHRPFRRSPRPACARPGD